MADKNLTVEYVQKYFIDKYSKELPGSGKKDAFMDALNRAKKKLGKGQEIQ